MATSKRSSKQPAPARPGRDFKIKRSHRRNPEDAHHDTPSHTGHPEAPNAGYRPSRAVLQTILEMRNEESVRCAAKRGGLPSRFNLDAEETMPALAPPQDLYQNRPNCRLWRCAPSPNTIKLPESGEEIDFDMGYGISFVKKLGSGSFGLVGLCDYASTEGGEKTRCVVKIQLDEWSVLGAFEREELWMRVCRASTEIFPALQPTLLIFHATGLDVSWRQASRAARRCAR